MKLKLQLLAVATLLISVLGFSQENASDKKDNLLFLVRKTEHINQVLKTVDQLHSTTASTLNIGKAVIIVCGEAVTSLDTKDAVNLVEKASKYDGVSIIACGLSLTKFNMNKSDLVNGVEYTENGFIKAFELQKQSYLSVEL